MNSVRLPTLYQLDVHADKAIGFGGSRRLMLNFDLLNVANSATILGRTTALMPRAA